MRGKGVPNVRGYGQGDQHIQVRVITPTKLSAQQKDLLREFSALSGKDAPDEQHDSFFAKVKRAFKGE